MTTTVDLATARAWVGVPATVLPDDQLQLILDGEQTSQARLCRIDPDNPQPDLDEALLRRVARAVAGKAVPLGLATTEYGPARIPILDGEIERLEGPTRMVVAG